MAYTRCVAGRLRQPSRSYQGWYALSEFDGPGGGEFASKGPGTYYAYALKIPHFLPLSHSCTPPGPRRHLGGPGLCACGYFLGIWRLALVTLQISCKPTPWENGS